MGISVKTVTEQQAEYYEIVVGAYVVTVESGSCADKAGLKVGDIITKLGDTDVTSSDTLKMAKKNFKAGDTTTMLVNRDGEALTLTITFDEEGVTSTASESTQQPPAWPGDANS
jgi:serine protease Do